MQLLQLLLAKNENYLIDDCVVLCALLSDPVKSKPIYSNSMLEWPTKEIKAGLSPARPDSVQGMLTLCVANWNTICRLEIDFVLFC